MRIIIEFDESSPTGAPAVTTSAAPAAANGTTGPDLDAGAAPEEIAGAPTAAGGDALSAGPAPDLLSGLGGDSS